MNPKKVIAVFFVLALLALAIGFGYMWWQSQQGPEGRYDFDGDRVNFYETESGLIIPELSDDKVFYRVEITLKNDRFDPGIKTENLVWKLTIDGTTVNQCDLVTKNKDFKNVTVETGQTVDYVVMFEIPKNTLGEKTELGYVYVSMDGNPKLGYDPDLTPVNGSVTVGCAVRHPA